MEANSGVMSRVRAEVNNRQTYKQTDRDDLCIRPYIMMVVRVCAAYHVCFDPPGKCEHGLCEITGPQTHHCICEPHYHGPNCDSV